MDAEGKGYFTVLSFVPLMGPLFNRCRLNEDNADDVFNMFDADSDGLFRAKDVTEVLSLLGRSFPSDYTDQMIDEVDMDGDKAVSIDEFKYFIAGEVF